MSLGRSGRAVAGLRLGFGRWHGRLWLRRCVLTGPAACPRCPGAETVDEVRELATAGFYDGLQAGCLVAAGVCLVGSVLAATLLPSRPRDEEPQQPAETASDPAYSTAGA